MIHIYIAKMQPATRSKDDCGAKPFWIRHPGNRLLHTECCRMNRQAKNLLVQHFYDVSYYFCRPGKGCKSEK